LNRTALLQRHSDGKLGLLLSLAILQSERLNSSTKDFICMAVNQTC
jgi:hypothetical protein